MRALAERRAGGGVRPWSRAAAALALVALVASAPVESDAGASTDEERAEAARAATTAARIERDWPLAGAGPLTRFVRKLGARLGERAGRTPFQWRFTVVRDRSANAFAIGGGRIYVNEGVVTLCETEAELAAILAHEMAHQLAGHFRHGSRGGGERIELGAVTQEIDPAKELEADRIALGILRNAGYDPHAALTLALRQKAHTGGAAPHLRDESRIDGLRAELRDVPTVGRADSAAYRELRRQMLQQLG